MPSHVQNVRLLLAYLVQLHLVYTHYPYDSCQLEVQLVFHIDDVVYHRILLWAIFEHSIAYLHNIYISEVILMGCTHTKLYVPCYVPSPTMYLKRAFSEWCYVWLLNLQGT